MIKIEDWMSPEQRKLAEEINAGEEELAKRAAGQETATPDLESTPKVETEAAVEGEKATDEAPAAAGEPATETPNATDAGKTMEQISAEELQRLRTAGGIAKAAGEEARLAHERNRELLAQLAETERRLKESATPTTTTAASAKTDTPPTASELEIMNGMIEDFGPELGKKMFKRLSDLASAKQGEIAAVLKGQLDPLQRTVQEQEQIRAKTAWDNYLAELYQGAPDADAVVSDPEFQKFAGIGGLQAIKLNEDARQAAPIIQQIKTFKIFKQNQTPAAPAAAPQPTKSDEQRSAVKAQAQPRPAASAPAATSGKRRYSQAEHDALYREISIPGRYSVEDSLRIQRELDEAYRERRIDR